MKKVLILLLLATSSLYLIFSIRTNLFFSLDDFAVLGYFKSHSVREMIREYFLYGDIWGFHKIIGYLNLRLLYDLFGVWPLPYIINNQLLHLGNVLLLFLIISWLIKDSFKSFFFSLIFNSLYLYYFSNVHEYLVSFLSLLTVYLYLKSHRLFALICFSLALLTKELAIGVPLLLFSLSLFQRKDIRPLFPFFSLAIFYLAYQLAFFVTKAQVGPDHPYATSTHPIIVWRNLRFYLSTPWLVIIGVSLIFTFRHRATLVLLTALLTLSPALILLNRQETYYLYLPLAYLSLYFALIMPEFRPRTAILFLVIFLFLGGRKLLPPLARQEFTNWQKHSVEQVVSLVRSKLESDPNVTRIIIDDAKLQRDARLMLESNTADLFLPAPLAQKLHSVKVVY